MGQIVIDIPNKKERRYVITDAKQADELLSALDLSAIRVKSNPPKMTRQQIEEIRDVAAAKRNIAEMRRTGVSYTVDELRKELGLT